MYISIYHLLWIVPLAAMVGMFFAVLISANGKE